MRLCPSIKPAQSPIQAVYAAQRLLPQRAVVFIDDIAAVFAATPGLDGMPVTACAQASGPRPQNRSMDRKVNEAVQPISSMPFSASSPASRRRSPCGSTSP